MKLRKNRKIKFLLLCNILFLASCNEYSYTTINDVYEYNDTFFKFHPNGYTLFEGYYEVNSLTTYTNLNTNEKQVNEVNFKGNLTFNKCNINEEVNFTGTINEGDISETTNKISNNLIETTTNKTTIKDKKIFTNYRKISNNELVETYTAGANNIVNTTFDFNFKTKFNLKKEKLIESNQNALYNTVKLCYDDLYFFFQNDTTERIETYSFDTRFIFNKATYSCRTIENNIEIYNTMTIYPINNQTIKISENYDKPYESDSYSLKI